MVWDTGCQVSDNLEPVRATVYRYRQVTSPHSQREALGGNGLEKKDMECKNEFFPISTLRNSRRSSQLITSPFYILSVSTVSDSGSFNFFQP
ncbi:hypothetical protein J6590_090126 [Homalodisca vitripennis]|nr:hypothetical protein J6590_090126 [Homalodisca vitripennis]